MNKLVIFDLDGTLLDTIQDIFDNVNNMLTEFGYPLRSIEEVKQFIGEGAKKLVERSLPSKVQEVELIKCFEYYNKRYTNSGSPKTALYNGIGEVLVQLKERGYKLAILTNKPQQTTNEVYKKYLAEYNFDIVVGQREGCKIKPHPETLLNIINKMDADKDKTYFIGDGETDVEVAKNANVKNIAVLWGFRTKNQLVKVGAENFVTEPSQILSIVK